MFIAAVVFVCGKVSKSGLVIILIIKMFIIIETSIAQNIFHKSLFPTADSLQFSSLTFDHMLDTYIWTGKIQKILWTDNWGVDFIQSVRSRFIKTSQVAIQDEYKGLISLRARIAQSWNITLKNSSNILSDNRAIDIGRMAQHQILAGLEFIPGENVATEILGGYELNSQENESDKGFTYALGFDANRISLEEFDASLQSSWNQSLIGKRSPRSGDIRVELIRDFGSGVQDSLSVNYNAQRREFYTSLTTSTQLALGLKHNIFRRDAELFEITNKMTYDLNEKISFAVSVGVYNQNIDRGYRYRDSLLILDSHIQEMQFFGSLSMQWQIFNWLRADTRLMFTEKDERHSVKDYNSEGLTSSEKQRINDQRSSAQRLENTAQRTTLAVDLTSAVTQNDSIRILASAGILRYDTPELLNTDDRDELMMTYGIETLHHFSTYLTLIANADITLFHLVYLHQDKSANNNWNRVLRFSPGVIYSPTKWFRTYARAEVLANYTVHDYEEQVASIKSFSFRQAMWSDSTLIILAKRIQFNFSGTLRIFERGTLKWKEFSERPETYFVEKTLWPEFVWSSDLGFKFGIGFRYFGQDRYKYQGGKRMLTHKIEALGPTVLCEWSGIGNEMVSINGWLEKQKSNGITTRTIANLSMRVGFIL